MYLHRDLCSSTSSGVFCRLTKPTHPAMFEYKLLIFVTGIYIYIYVLTADFNLRNYGRGFYFVLVRPLVQQYWMPEWWMDDTGTIESTYTTGCATGLTMERNTCRMYRVCPYISCIYRLLDFNELQWVIPIYCYVFFTSVLHYLSCSPNKVSEWIAKFWSFLPGRLLVMSASVIPVLLTMKVTGHVCYDAFGHVYPDYGSYYWHVS